MFQKRRRVEEEREREREIFFLSKYFPPPLFFSFFVFSEKDLKMKEKFVEFMVWQNYFSPLIFK